MARNRVEAGYRVISFGIWEATSSKRCCFELCLDYKVPTKLFCVPLALPITQSNMKKPNMWRLTDTLSKRDWTMVASPSLTYPQTNRLQRGSSDKTLIHVLASWVFLTFSSQLETSVTNSRLESCWKSKGSCDLLCPDFFIILIRLVLPINIFPLYLYYYWWFFSLY